jgi:hypothetical protein
MCTSQRRCRCAVNQGGCKTNSNCQGGPYCAKNVGVYEHLVLHTMDILDLNACLAPSSQSTFAAVDTNAVVVPVEVVAPRTDGIAGKEAHKALDDGFYEWIRRQR